MTSAPAFVRASNPLSRRLLRLGLPAGPNVLLTVRGRTSGQPRTAPVAIVELDGRRWIIGAYGDVQWVRNLRAAGQAEIRVRGGKESVASRELDRTEATDFYARILPTYVDRLPWFGRLFARNPLRRCGAGGPQRPRARGAYASRVRTSIRNQLAVPSESAATWPGRAGCRASAAARLGTTDAYRPSREHRDAQPGAWPRA